MTGHENANTRITLTPVGTSTKVFGPAADFWYHRRSLSELMADLGFEGGVLTQSAQRTSGRKEPSMR
jgi:hypothetical protein